MTKRARTWRFTAGIFSIALLLYMGMIAAVAPLQYAVKQHFPENYSWQFRKAMAAKDYDLATDIARNRTDREYYDFKARRFLAEALIANQNTKESIDILLTSLDRTFIISGRKVFSIALNRAADLKLLSTALAQDGQTAFSNDMKRAAIDAQRISSLSAPIAESKEPDTNDKTSSPLILQQIELSHFHLSDGAMIKPDGSILFSRNSTATGTVDLAIPPPPELTLLIKGSKAMGIGAYLKISAGKSELMRIYADSRKPRWVMIPLNDTNTTGTIKLTLQFLNDGYDPLSSTDRNVEVVRAGFTGSPN